MSFRAWQAITKLVKLSAGGEHDDALRDWIRQLISDAEDLRGTQPVRGPELGSLLCPLRGNLLLIRVWPYPGKAATRSGRSSRREALRPGPSRPGWRSRSSRRDRPPSGAQWAARRADLSAHHRMRAALRPGPGRRPAAALKESLPGDD
jgi:hypothetical protein